MAHGKREITYVHLLFEQHQIIFAEGTPSESFYPGPQGLGALNFQARAEVFALFPELRHAAIQHQTARRFLPRRLVHRNVAARFDLCRAES